jgi:hypothetical protein
MSKSIELDESKLPVGMVEARKREDVAEIIYDWLHENQITHRRTYAQIPDDQKTNYREVADRIINRLAGKGSNQ